MPSALLDGPVAVPGVRLADSAAALHTDRCHSLPSLHPPQAAVGSLSQRATLVGLITRTEDQGLLCAARKTKPTLLGGLRFFWQVAPKKILACLLLYAYVNITG